MIKVKPNKNVIFTTAVLNINNPKDRKKFSLYEKIADKFEKLIPESFWIEFEKEYKNDKMFLIDTIRHEQDLYEKMCEKLLNFQICK